MQSIRPFHGDDAIIGTEFPGQGAVAGVDGIHEFRPALQEAICEPPNIAAEIGGNKACDIELELVEGMFELETGARDEGNVFRRTHADRMVAGRMCQVAVVA